MAPDGSRAGVQIAPFCASIDDSNLAMIATTMTTRELEPGIVTDLTNRLTYAGYLRLDLLLSAQQPLSGTAARPRATTR